MTTQQYIVQQSSTAKCNNDNDNGNDNNNNDSHASYSSLYTLSRRQTPPLNGLHIFVYGQSAQSYIRNTDVTRAISLSSADVRMTVFMSFCIRTNSFIVWAVNTRKTSDNLTVRVIPFIMSSVLQSNFSWATSTAIHQYSWTVESQVTFGLPVYLTLEQTMHGLEQGLDFRTHWIFGDTLQHSLEERISHRRTRQVTSCLVPAFDDT